MSLTHDVYAETNPAFCTYALVNFLQAYLTIKKTEPELPAVYLALPLALSGDLTTAFNGTNKNTGLLEWLERSPQVQIGLAGRINASLDIVTEAVRFGCFTKSIGIGEDARLLLGEHPIKQSAMKGLDGGAILAIKRSERLGYWFAMAGSTRNIFDSMGLTV